MELVKCIAIIILCFVLFWLFGSILTRCFVKEKCSIGLTLILGFFGYYTLFQIITIPMMFAMQPLSHLTALWTCLVGIVMVLSIAINKKRWTKEVGALCTYLKAGDWKKREYFWDILVAAVILINVIIVSVIYSSYWDATYYVGTVSYSVYYDTINTIYPLSGALMEALDIKHCLATYHMNDAVFCQLFGIHPMIQTKTIMVAVITIILNIVYMQFGRLFFGSNRRRRAMFQLFCLLINLCTYTAYTSSSFIMLRTYEGKAVAGAIVSACLLYWFISLFIKEKRFYWFGLFVTAWGAISISSSAVFIVLAGIGCFSLVEAVHRRQFLVLVKGFLCAVPALIILGCYLLNNLGIFVVYIH